MMRPLRTLKRYRRFRRYREVLFTLAKHGFDDLVYRILPETGLWTRFWRRRGAVSDVPTPVRLRQACAELGPTFVKVGQLLSTRPDVVPDVYLVELEKLQDEVPPFPYAEAKRIIEEEFGKSPEELFSSFEEKPIASGSIAQVHRASLQDGQLVAVKIQRPHIRRLIEVDLEILDEISALAERHIAEAHWIRPRELVSQFSGTIRRELDFIAEAQAAEHFRRNFEDDSSYLIPRVEWEFTSTRVLTIQFVDGVKITNREQLEAGGFDRKAIARNGVRAILREIFEHHFFHADPHPGNFFVLEGNVIASFDFGIVGRLDEESVDQLGILFTGVVKRDIPQIVRAFRALGLITNETDVSILRLDLIEVIDNYYDLPIGKIDSERMFRDLLQMLRRHRIVLPVNLALMGRMLTHAAGVGRMLDPEFNLLEEAKPIVFSFLAKRADPRRHLKGMLGTWLDYQAFLKNLPADLDEIIAKVKRGKMVVALHHEGLSRFILEMDRSSNRLAFGLIVASLIVGSSLVMQLERGPTILGFPALGFIGYLIAGVLGLWLVIAILRSGRI